MSVKRTPNWVWLSFFPILGGLAIAYAGRKSRTPAWVWLGCTIVALAIILSSTDLALLIWLSQIAIAFSLKKRFLLLTAPRGLAIPDAETAQLIAATRGKIDINSCSKDELVYDLGLPIVYANEIESLRHEGYIFTYLEELSEIAGIPESYLSRLEPLIVFYYDINKEADVSWRKFNTFSFEELVACNLDIAVAQKIITERQLKGPYKSLMDVRHRTGLPLGTYRHLI